MASAPYSYLLEETLLAGIEGESWASGVSTFGSMGGEITSFPAIRVSTTKGTEEPENSGNYNMTAEIQVFGRVDPDNDSTYASAVGDHVELAGNVQEWITNTLAVSTLEASVSGYTNTLKVYNIRMDSFSRAIDNTESVFEDMFSLEVYLKED
jgi:hypothetical protein